MREQAQGSFGRGGKAPADPTRSSFDHDYWLARCVGFTVTSPEGRRLGRVAWLRFGSQLVRPDLLAVRGGLLGHRLHLVPSGAVERVLPRERRLVLRAPPGRGASTSLRRNG